MGQGRRCRIFFGNCSKCFAPCPDFCPISRTINPEQVLEMWKAKDPHRFLFLDCRGWGNAEPFVQKYPEIWRSIPQDQLQQRLAEVPQNRRLILVCNTGVRSYEAQIALDQAGLVNCLNLQGGVAALKKLGLDI